MKRKVLTRKQLTELMDSLTDKGVNDLFIECKWEVNARKSEGCTKK